MRIRRWLERLLFPVAAACLGYYLYVLGEARLYQSFEDKAGSDARTLRLAVGYIPGTALPGENGNVGLAGHRDTFFRKLRDIDPGDEIRVTTKDGGSAPQRFIVRAALRSPDLQVRLPLIMRK